MGIACSTRTIVRAQRIHLDVRCRRRPMSAGVLLHRRMTTCETEEFRIQRWMMSYRITATRTKECLKKS